MSIDWNKPIVIDKKILDCIRKIIDNIYLVLLTVFCVKTIVESSMFNLVIPFDFYYEFQKVLVCVVLLKLIISWDTYKGRKLIIIALGIAAHMMYIIGTFEMQMFVWLLVVGAADIPYEKILKIFFWCAAGVLIVSMAASFTGMAKHLIFVKHGALRYSFGICYPTDFSAYLLFTTLFGWVVYGKGKELLMSVIFLAEAVFIYVFCRVWCSSFVAICACVMALYNLFITRKGDSDHKFIICLKKVMWQLEQWAFVIGGTVMITLTALYTTDNSLLVKINDVLTNRLAYGKEVFLKQGIHAFGKYFALRGYGGYDAAPVKNFCFVDSSYCLILVRYGIVLLIILTALYFCVIRKAKANGNEALVAVMALMALHSMIEHHWSDTAFNPTLFLLFSKFYPLEAAEEAKTPIKLNMKVFGRLIAIAAYVIIAVICFGQLISHLRTYVGACLRQETYGCYHFILVVLTFCFAAWLYLWGLVKAKGKKLICCITLSVLLHACVIGLVGFALKHNYGKYLRYIDGSGFERDILAQAKEQNCDIYVEDVPEYYDAYGYDISSKVIMGNGLCTEQNAIILTKPGDEYHRLLRNGYIYCEILDTRALYTDNNNLIRILDNEGYEIIKEFEVDKERYMDVEEVSDYDW